MRVKIARWDLQTGDRVRNASFGEERAFLFWAGFVLELRAARPAGSGDPSAHFLFPAWVVTMQIIFRK